jgi:hypothetical protein
VSRSAIDLLNREWATGAHDAGRGTLPNAGSCATPLFGYFRSYAMTGYGDVVPVRMVACGVYRIGHLEFSPSGQLAQALSTR